MEYDYVYVYNFENSYVGYRLGEIQANFNMSFTIDGTKDSCKIVVQSFYGEEVKPYSIVRHVNTGTWWIVSHDKVTRRMNEVGFYYTHELSLLGAKELLNARDLTDCGFNENKYTFSEFIERLFKLSSFEFPVAYDLSCVDIDQIITNIKTYENYTLASALREFLDNFNLTYKLEFAESVSYEIGSAIFTLIPKTGDITISKIDIDTFDDVRETRTIDKNSYGQLAISNAENVISTGYKKYPSIGSAKLSATAFEIQPWESGNTIFRLPSAVFKGIWLKMYIPYIITMDVGSGIPFVINIYSQTEDNIDNVFEKLKDGVDTLAGTASWKQQVKDLIEENRQSIINILLKAYVVTFYTGNELNASDGTIVKGEDVPYIPKFAFAPGSLGDQNYQKVIFTDKQTRECLKDIKQGIYYERGKDYISGFEFLRPDQNNQINTIVKLEDTDYQSSNTTILDDDDLGITISLANLTSVDYRKISFAIKYIPMSDLKVIHRNKKRGNDMHLYNQTGKLTDSNAFSKLLDSYSKTITTNNVVRYMHYYNFNNIPKVGQIVYETLQDESIVDYVINNVSMDFYQNENGYFIDCEFTMSKNVAVKSLLTNPNTNIREYGIPQNFNVKRKQVYSYFYELTKNAVMLSRDLSNPFRALNFTNFAKNNNDHVGVMKLTWANQVNSSYYGYYQLESTKYVLYKSYIEILDFKDNNIIGYGNQNAFSGFDITRIFDHSIDSYNTPISYVDNNGEVKDIDILFVTQDNLITIYEDYQTDEGYGSDNSVYLPNYSVYIPHDIYDNALSVYSYRLNEENYYKDAIEVPVFELLFQMNDNDYATIGGNIFNEYQDNFYFYKFAKVDKGMANELNASSFMSGTITNLLLLLIADNVCSFTTNTQILLDNKVRHVVKIKLYYQQQINTYTKEITNGTPLQFTKDKDLVIFRYAYDMTTNKVHKDLFMIIKDIDDDENGSFEITRYIDVYQSEN